MLLYLFIFFRELTRQSFRIPGPIDMHLSHPTSHHPGLQWQRACYESHTTAGVVLRRDEPKGDGHEARPKMGQETPWT